MYNTTQDYKDKILNDSTQHELNIYIDNNKIEPNHIIDFKSTLELFNNNEFCLGSTPEIDIEFEIDRRDLPESYNEVHVESGLEDEIIPIGKFTIQSIEDDEFKVKIKATDYMKKFDDNKYDGSDLTYPATMLQVLQDICTKIGVELGSTSFLNDDKQIAVYDNTVTARTYIGYIAEQAGGFAVIGRDGKLYIKTFGEDTANIDINLFGNFKLGDKFSVSKVSYEDGTQNYKFGDETASTVYINQNNMYIVDSEQIENIYNQIKDFEVYSFEGETIIDPAYDIGDILIIDGKKVIYQGELEYAGKFKANIKSKIQAKTEQESMQTKSNSSEKIRRVQSQIDQAEGKITQLIQETSDVAEKANRIDSTVEGTTQTISSLNASLEGVLGTINELKTTIEGLKNTLKTQGGSNLLRNSVGAFGTEYWKGNVSQYTDTDVFQNNVSKSSIFLANGDIEQNVAPIKNGTYNISFNYKKKVTASNVTVSINEKEETLNSEEWTLFEKVIIISNNQFTIKFSSDTDNSCLISDLILTLGETRLTWSQNPNETNTETVQIGEGIRVDSSKTNTYTRIDSDGNRTFNKSTDEVVTEQTDKGTKTNNLTVSTQAQITGLLQQKHGDQVWVNVL